MTLTSRESYFSATQIVVEVLVETHFQVFFNESPEMGHTRNVCGGLSGGRLSKAIIHFFFANSIEMEIEIHQIRQGRGSLSMRIAMINFH